MTHNKQGQPANPFIDHGYVSPKYFCDREAETKSIISALRNGRNITMLSPRRVGKTGLIKNAFYRIREKERNARKHCCAPLTLSTRADSFFPLSRLVVFLFFTY